MAPVYVPPYVVVMGTSHGKSPLVDRTIHHFNIVLWFSLAYDILCNLPNGILFYVIFHDPLGFHYGGFVLFM